MNTFLYGAALICLFGLQFVVALWYLELRYRLERREGKLWGSVIWGLWAAFSCVFVTFSFGVPPLLGEWLGVFSATRVQRTVNLLLGPITALIAMASAVKFSRSRKDRSWLS